MDNKVDSVHPDRIILDKIETLNNLLTNVTFERETVIGFNQNYKPVLDEKEEAKVKKKIFELINKL